MALVGFGAFCRVAGPFAASAFLLAGYATAATAAGSGDLSLAVSVAGQPTNAPPRPDSPPPACGADGAAATPPVSIAATSAPGAPRDAAHRDVRAGREWSSYNVSVDATMNAGDDNAELDVEIVDANSVRKESRGAVFDSPELIVGGAVLTRIDGRVELTATGSTQFDPARTAAGCETMRLYNIRTVNGNLDIHLDKGAGPGGGKSLVLRGSVKGELTSLSLDGEVCIKFAKGLWNCANPSRPRWDDRMSGGVERKRVFPQVDDTPEASTWTMMVLGFAGVALLGLRARRKASAAGRRRALALSLPAATRYSDPVP